MAGLRDVRPARVGSTYIGDTNDSDRLSDGGRGASDKTMIESIQQGLGLKQVNSNNVSSQYVRRMPRGAC